ncbi:MAG: CehA/McbA family metallohydrolase [Acidobacteria bacterium]|nr:CehA/McbA family metallohydrolase [Acidobacteriota bacterium]
MKRAILALTFLAALAWAQFRESGLASIAARLEVTTEPLLPARVYLFKNNRPFRLSPVDAMLPLRTDTFYRERLWLRTPTPATLEVTSNDISHFFLLKGKAGFDLPAGEYRIEAYRGLAYKPVIQTFTLDAGKTTNLKLRLEDWTNGESKRYLSSDDHIHLIRAPQEDPIFLDWLEAEDLSVGNFLQLQRQMDAATQYGFGPKAEAKRTANSIRSGHESRSEFFGHINILGGRELIRPLSVGKMYANTPETFPYPFVLFDQGRKLGATVGFAHFRGSTPHSSFIMDVALGSLQFTEVFQFGKLWKDEWYEILNAGFKLTGVAGSDFPVALNRWTSEKQWSRWLPLLGPERLMIRAAAGPSAYEAWAKGVRNGEGFVTNGPLIDLKISGNQATATTRFFRPLDRLEIVANGQVIATAGPGPSLTTQAAIPANGPVWIAARAIAKPDTEGTPDIQAHTNPHYIRWTGEPPKRDARAQLAARWQAEIDYYQTAPLVFPNDAERRTFFDRAQQALAILRK